MTATPLVAPEAEEAVLGGLLAAQLSTVLQVREVLPDPAWFTRDAHAAIYAGILALAATGATLDPVVLEGQLRRDGLWERAGGLDALVHLADVGLPPGNLLRHAALIRDLATRRQVARAAGAALEQAHDLTAPIEATTSALVDGLVRHTLTAPEADKPPEVELLDVLTEVERVAKDGDGSLGLPSGLADLDALTDGWVPGRLIVVAARPSVGKTAFGLHCAHVASGMDEPVYFASLEQPRREMFRRLIGLDAGLNLRTVRSPTMLDAVASDLARAAERIRSRLLRIDQRAPTPALVRLGVQRYAAELGRKVGLVVVDYLGLLQSGRKADRHDIEIGYMTRDLARLAIDLEVPVLLLCQLNRESVKGGTVRRPTLSDLRDSGNIEQDAGQVVFLFRQEDWPPDQMELGLAKNRYGPRGRVNVAFDRDTGRWRGWSSYRVAEAA